jgi:SAM-dependent methyltransferase
VTVLDNAPAQLGQDELVAQREGLTIKTVEGDMADLSMFENETFGLIVHPCSNCFVPDVRPVWREAFRVLRPGGVLLAGFVNPLVYLFHADALETGDLTVTQTLPWSTLEALSQEELAQRKADGEPLWFGHLLTDQIGGQIDAGFMLGGFYEDDHGEDDALSRFTPWLIGTRAIRPVQESG